MTDLEKKFSKLYDEYIDKIYRFIFFKVNSQEIAEDLTSEAFLRSWKAMLRTGGQDNWTIENPSAFIYQIARNLVIDFYRDKSRTKIISADLGQLDASIVASSAESIEQKAIINSDLESIKKSLVGIKEEYKDIIVLHYIEDFTIAETAKILKKSEGATRVMLHRAMAALKSKINEGASIGETNTSLSIEEA